MKKPEIIDKINMVSDDRMRRFLREVMVHNYSGSFDRFLDTFLEMEIKCIAHDHLLDQLAKDCKCKEYLAEYNYKGPTLS